MRDLAIKWRLKEYMDLECELHEIEESTSEDFTDAQICQIEELQRQIEDIDREIEHLESISDSQYELDLMDRHERDD